MEKIYRIIIVFQSRNTVKHANYLDLPESISIICCRIEDFSHIFRFIYFVRFQYLVFWCYINYNLQTEYEKPLFFIYKYIFSYWLCVHLFIINVLISMQVINVIPFVINMTLVLLYLLCCQRVLQTSHSEQRIFCVLLS